MDALVHACLPLCERCWARAGRLATASVASGRGLGQAGSQRGHAGEQLVLEAPAETQHCAAAQPHFVVTLEQRRERGNLGDVHGGGLVDAHEALFAQLRQQVRERAAHDVARVRGVDVHVVVVGFEPVNGGGIDELQLLAAAAPAAARWSASGRARVCTADGSRRPRRAARAAAAGSSPAGRWS